MRVSEDLSVALAVSLAVAERSNRYRVALELRGLASRVFRRFQRRRPGDIGISAITYSELCYGVASSSRPEQNQAALAEFAAPLRICDRPADVGIAYGQVRAELRRRRQSIGPPDLLIAAHALHLDVVLVTNDAAEFRRIPALRVENWV